MPAGRPRKPTVKHKLDGTFRIDRQNPDEPMPDTCIPKKPVFLKGPAAKEWKRITVELAQQKLISQLDMAACAGYCFNFGEVVKITKQIEKDGGITAYLLLGAKGSTILNPLVKARKDALKLMMEFGREFGMSPVSRTRVSVADNAVEDEWEKYTNAG